MATKNTKLTAEEWVQKRFPNTAARKAADDASMALSDDESVRRHLQVWVDTYASVAGHP